MPKSEGYKNLQPLNGSDPEREYNVHAAGGRAAAQVVKRKKALRDILDTILALPAESLVADDEIGRIAKDAAMQAGETVTAYDAIMIAMTGKAAKGDVDAARFVRDSAGDKPTEKQTVAVDVITAADAEIAKKVAARLEKAKETK
jgi:hypothetical protein